MRSLHQGKKVFLSSTLKNEALIPKSFLKLRFDEIKTGILGEEYELSIVLTGKDRIKSLNNKYRKIDKPTDVLSFDLPAGPEPHSKTSGEIFICPAVAKIKSKKFGKTFSEYLLFLVIHAIFHLKGMEHGSKMEKYEFTHYSRYRRRHL